MIGACKNFTSSLIDRQWKMKIVGPSNVKTFIALFESLYTNNVFVAILFSKLAFKVFDVVRKIQINCIHSWFKLTFLDTMIVNVNYLCISQNGFCNKDIMHLPFKILWYLIIWSAPSCQNSVMKDSINWKHGYRVSCCGASSIICRTWLYFWHHYNLMAQHYCTFTMS